MADLIGDQAEQVQGVGVFGRARENLPVQALGRVQAPRLVVRQCLLQEPPIGWVLGRHACLDLR